MSINIELEKIVFLFNADEGNYGIYELVCEFGRYEELDIDEKYRIAKKIILSLVEEELCYVQTYFDYEFKKKADIIKQDALNKFLNNPSNWYPNNLPLPCLEITKNGFTYLDKAVKERNEELNIRLFNNK